MKKFVSRIPKFVWILAPITAIGIYLRTYRFHDWLYFYPDQARDVKIVGDYLNGKIPLPLMGFRAASTNFDLGAMYYYFQIASGKLFGVSPDTMAYPDLFFNILAIPLFFYFLTRYFKTNLSLALTAIYAVSFVAIEYSRFAWNPNSMPFFVLLFLLSIWKFLTEKEKTHWGWLAALGISIGIGIQLHTILIFLLTLVAIVVFLLTMKSNWRLWKRWLLVAGIVLLLNTNQIVSETKHNFSNTKRLLHLSKGSAQSGGTNEKFNPLALDFACHAQANAHMITSLGNKVECDYLRLATAVPAQISAGTPGYWATITDLAASLIFSALGYGLLIYFYSKEEDPKKKNFLGLICLYVGLSFIIVYPVIKDAPLRYYLQVFFVPYLFLGFLFEFIRRKYPKISLPAAWAAVILLMGFNFSTIRAEAKLYAANSHSQPQYVVLGELIHMRDYILTETGPRQKIYMIADGKYMQNYFYPLAYDLSRKNISLLREQKDYNNIPPDAQLFYLGKKGGNGLAIDSKGFPVQRYRNFGEIGIYMLQNQRQAGSRSLPQNADDAVN